MQHYKLNFRNRPLAEQLLNCEQHVANVSQLPKDQRAQVNLAQLTDSVSAARASFDRVEVLRTELKTEITRRNQLIRTARQHTERAVGMVAVNAGLQPHAMVAAGLELEHPRQPVGKPAAPTDFHAEPHSNEGAARLRWKRPVRRCSFMVEIRTDAETEWTKVETCVPTKTVIEGLTSGVKYWFRVCAVNAYGYGPWSNAVSVRVK